MPNWKKVIVSGSDASLYTLTVANGITGSLQGTASYAITASYALNGGSGGGTIYVMDEGVSQGSASYFNFVGGGVTATVTSGTASLSIPGLIITGSNAILVQTTPATTWSFAHNLGEQFPVFTIFDSNDDVIMPSKIHADNAYTASIYFSSARSGRAVAANCGLSGSIPFVTASYALSALSASNSLTASYVNPLHQTVQITGSTAALALLGSGSGLFTIDGTLGRMFTVDDSVSGSLFSVVTGSLAILEVFSDKKINMSGSVFITGSLYATTFTVASTLTLDATLTDYHTVASSTVGSNNLFTQATGSYTSAFFKYTVSNGANARAGEVMTAWNGTTATYTDTSTTDIGNTSAVTCSTAIVGSDIQFNIYTGTSGWKLKSLATYM
jgi:hypothetical protein